MTPVAIIFVPYYVAELTNGQAYGLVFGLVLLFVVFAMPDGLIGRLRILASRVVAVERDDGPDRSRPQPGLEPSGRTTTERGSDLSPQAQSKEIA